VLRKIFGPKREEVAGGWKGLNQELQALNASPNIVTVIKSRGVTRMVHVARMKEMRNAYKIYVGKTGGKIPLGRPRRRWDGNIKMELREIR